MDRDISEKVDSVDFFTAPDSKKFTSISCLSMKTSNKYESSTLIEMFRLAAELRRKMLDAGFTDNGGAIHSAERILNILGLRLCYPGLSHINKLKNYPNARFSVEALAAHEAGEKVLIEHVSPHRALTRAAIDKIESGSGNEELATYVKANFRLALLTQEETTRLNKINRSRLDPKRLESADIHLTILR